MGGGGGRWEGEPSFVPEQSPPPTTTMALCLLTLRLRVGHIFLLIPRKGSLTFTRTGMANSNVDSSLFDVKLRYLDTLGLDRTLLQNNPFSTHPEKNILPDPKSISILPLVTNWFFYQCIGKRCLLGPSLFPGYSQVGIVVVGGNMMFSLELSLQGR